MEEQQTIQPKKSTILLIEDAQFITELYTRALTKAGFEVKSERDGAEALKIAQEGDFDVILLDIMLPSMSGVEMLEKLKGTIKPVSSKIIITTNLDQPEDARANIERLADGYLIKAEITPKELVSYIKQALGI